MWYWPQGDLVTNWPTSNIITYAFKCVDKKSITNHSHTRRLLSSDVETKRRFWSTKVMVFTAPRCRSYSWTISPDLISHCTLRTPSPHKTKKNTRRKKISYSHQKLLVTMCLKARKMHNTHVGKVTFLDHQIFQINIILKILGIQLETYAYNLLIRGSNNK